MAYTAPTASDIKTRFPRFAALSDASIDAVIAEANRSVDTSWFEGDYKNAIQFLTAHMLMTEEGETAGSRPRTGALKSKSLGDASESYETLGRSSGAASWSEYESTSYGRSYLALLRKNHPAALITA